MSILGCITGFDREPTGDELPVEQTVFQTFLCPRKKKKSIHLRVMDFPANKAYASSNYSLKSTSPSHSSSYFSKRFQSCGVGPSLQLSHAPLTQTSETSFKTAPVLFPSSPAGADQPHAACYTVHRSDRRKDI